MPNFAPRIVLGLMTGTSADGIDIGVIKTDGIKIFEFGAQGFFPYDAATRQQIKTWFGRDDIDPVHSSAADFITQLHATAVKDFLSQHPALSTAIDAVGFHGQTIYHAPEKKITCQLGNGADLAATLQLPVVWQFRQQDIALGGQGAPLMPLAHCAVADYFQLAAPLVFCNIGGVANITFIKSYHPPQNAPYVWAGDVGPGNAMIDDYAQQYLNQPQDKNGDMAMTGIANKQLVKKWLSHEFFAKPIPKSLDRDMFKQMVFSDLTDSDHQNNLATLALFTGQAILHAVKSLPFVPTTLLVAGGGRHNAAIMKHLAQGLTEQQMILQNLDDATDKKIADNLEAFGFAFLTARAMAGLPLTLPTTTGVMAPTTGGVLSRPPTIA